MARNRVLRWSPVRRRKRLLRLGIEIDATFIALVAFTIFFAVMIYLKVPGMVLSALDQRSAAIAKELHDARRLREEAEKLLKDNKQPVVDSK